MDEHEERRLLDRLRSILVALGLAEAAGWSDDEIIDKVKAVAAAVRGGWTTHAIDMTKANEAFKRVAAMFEHLKSAPTIH